MANLRGTNRFGRLPQELKDRILYLAFEDVIAAEDPIELVQGLLPWKIKGYHYTTDSNGYLTRTLPGSCLPPFPPNLLPFDEPTRKNIVQTIQRNAPTNLVFANTLTLTRIIPSFASGLKEVTILKHYQAGAYHDSGTPTNQDALWKNFDLFASLECLKDCAQLEILNIDLSIFNCEWQFMVSHTISSARPLLGTRARICLAVKHCIHCSHVEPGEATDAFNISDFPFNVECNRIGHELKEREYWEWVSQPGSLDWKIKRFLMTEDGKTPRYGMLEILDDYENELRDLGLVEAESRMQSRALVLRQKGCHVCHAPVTNLPLNLRVSRPWWCRYGCGDHLVCPEHYHAHDGDRGGRWVSIRKPSQLTFLGGTPVFNYNGWTQLPSSDNGPITNVV